MDSAPPSSVGARLLDAGLSVALAVMVAVAISAAPEQGGSPSLAAYTLAPVVGILALFRRRRPLGVLIASAVSVQTYNLFDNPGIFAAVPLSVSLATAWAAGRRVWSIAC